MSNTTQKALDAILEALQNNEEIRPITGRRRFNGTSNADIFIGSDRNNVARGKRGNDILVGIAGNNTLDGGNGNDLLIGGDGIDVLSGGNNRDTLLGGAGDDQLDGGNGNDFLDGGLGADVLTGGNGVDQLVGGAGVDTLTGGADRDQFIYNGDLFANGTPALVAAPNIKVLNTPDIITDYTIGEDQFVFDKANLGSKDIVFQKGTASGIAADGNVIVLTDGFAAAGAAARAIANNENIQAKEGVFVYFNTTLGLTRTVYSQDLANGGDISVLANLDNQRGAVGQANIANFTANDFGLA
jgi:Ca2+-binding RTX toxin-like protein